MAIKNKVQFCIKLHNFSQSEKGGPQDSQQIDN